MCDLPLFTFAMKKAVLFMPDFNGSHLKELMHAIQFACHKHRFQSRKVNERGPDGDQEQKQTCKIPYIKHPIDVVALLTKCGITDVNVLIAAVLHDVYEDTLQDNNQTFEDMRAEVARLFGQEVDKYVMECTDDKSLDKIQRKRAQLAHAGTISRGAKLVKLADKFANLSDPAPASWSAEELRGYTYWSYAVVNEARGVHEELDRQLDDLFRTKLSLPKDQITPELLAQELENYYKVIDGSD